MNDLDRSLSILADGTPVISFRRARLIGQDMLGLYPMPFTLYLWNPSEDDYLLIASAKTISVSNNNSLLASGFISNVCRKAIKEGSITEVVFAAGLSLWEANISLLVNENAKISETVSSILAASNTGISLLSFPGSDPVRSRPQAFFGRAAECIESALTRVDARAYLADTGLCIVPSDGLPISMSLSDEDLWDDPVIMGGKLMLLRTRITGWPLGKMISVSWKGTEITGLVSERSVDADNLDGNWQSELLVEVSI